MKLFSLLLTAAVGVAAQNIHLGFPLPAADVTRGKNMTVEVDKPVRRLLYISFLPISPTLTFTEFPLWLDRRRHRHRPPLLRVSAQRQLRLGQKRPSRDPRFRPLLWSLCAKVLHHPRRGLETTLPELYRLSPTHLPAGQRRPHRHPLRPHRRQSFASVSPLPLAHPVFC